MILHEIRRVTIEFERNMNMTRALKNFAYENIHKVDSFNRNPEYSQALNYACKHENELMARLNDEDKTLFKKFLDVNGSVIRLTAEDNLVYGYVSGVTITAEAFIIQQS